MEQYLRQRIDCPLPGGTRTLLEEKDNIIKKQQDDLNKLQIQVKQIQIERDYIFSLLSNEQKSNLNPITDKTTSFAINIIDIRPTPSSNNSITNYELSQDLHDKQIEILERKYGGNLRCRHAATIIQRAYRQYKLKENFRHLCATIKTNKRLSCTFINQNSDQKPLKPCLRLGKKSERYFPDHHLDLPSINFEHFIESTKQQDNLSNHRKRVCIITDKPLKNNIYEQVDNLSDFIDRQIIEHNGSSLNDLNFYKDLTDSSIQCRKSTPSVRSLSLKSRPIDSQGNTSPIWKRKSSLTTLSPMHESSDLLLENSNHSLITCISPSSTLSSDHDDMSLKSLSSGSNSGSLSNRLSANSIELHQQQPLIIEYQTVLQGEQRLLNIRNNEIYRRRCYRAGLNIFNKKPERGIRYLIAHRFLDSNAQAVARFLLSRKGLSRQMIGDYLGNIQDPFAMQVLHAFVNEFDFHDMPIDIALRKFQSTFRLPGEAQKIEQLMKVFAQRYYVTNPSSSSSSSLSNVDTIFILAFAIIMLNTDLHSRNIKPERKMRLEQFIKNLRAIDDGEDLDINYLTSIYERIRADEFRPDNDHVTQVLKFEQALVGKKPTLTAPHRRLVCYCRLYEIHDVTKREKLTAHQREVYLFNDLLIITKLSGRKRQQFRQAFRLLGMNIYLFETPYHQYGIRLIRKSDRTEINLIIFNARNEHDRTKFCDDLKEAILEMNEMEGLRRQSEFDKIRGSSSSLVDITNNNGILSSFIDNSTIKRDRPLSRTLSNSLLDITLPINNHQSIPCQTSQCSLDSGMVNK
ncbi:unnamed protein product [Adineta steineri]|uniref:SEC7 domain-containing protein n=2 Tax=Adineta steineri TaxID=433720 RepID=A0A818K1N7_9BILA|nr:unnamed protein product [Adineta steineri]CAF3552272.1 unnamed protein product [Adineta steineri]